MDHPPGYDISEFLLCGLCIAGAGVCLVWASAAFFTDSDYFTAAEGAGLALMFLGGCVHPRKYLLDCVLWSTSWMQNTGRETPLTVFAAGAGFVLWLVGIAGNYWG